MMSVDATTTRDVPATASKPDAQTSPAAPAKTARTGRLQSPAAARKAATPGAKRAPSKSSAVPAAPPARVDKVKAKLVRDSFTMPQADFDLIARLKHRAVVGFQRPAKKSELLRAGLHALTALDDAALHVALDALVPLKPGRPKKAG